MVVLAKGNTMEKSLHSQCFKLGFKKKTLLSSIYMYQLQAHQCYVVLVMNDDDDDDDDDDQLYLITLAYSTMQKHQLVSSRGVS